MLIRPIVLQHAIRSDCNYIGIQVRDTPHYTCSSDKYFVIAKNYVQQKFYYTRQLIKICNTQNAHREL